MKITRFKEIIITEAKKSKKLFWTDDKIDEIKDYLYIISDDFEVKPLKVVRDSLSIDIDSKLSQNNLVGIDDIKSYQDSLTKRLDLMERCKDFTNRVSLIGISPSVSLLTNKIIICLNIKKDSPISFYSSDDFLDDFLKVVINSSMIEGKLKELDPSNEVISIEVFHNEENDCDEVIISFAEIPNRKAIKYLEGTIPPSHRDDVCVVSGDNLGEGEEKMIIITPMERMASADSTSFKII